MSVETLSPSNPVEHLRTEDVQTALEGILSATNEHEAREQRLGFEEIARLFQEAHARHIEDLELQREIQHFVIDELVDNPEKAFHGEFLQLKMLYENRTTSLTRYDGTVEQEFCTQNHARATCDHLFRYTLRPDGTEKYQVDKVYEFNGQPEPIQVIYENGELSVIAKKYERGRTHYVEIEGENREMVLAELFYGTIRASAIQLERSADERDENDARAKRYLKGVRENEYVLI